MPSFLAGETGFLGPYFNLLPMFTIVLFFGSTNDCFTPPAVDDQQKDDAEDDDVHDVLYGHLVLQGPLRRFVCTLSPPVCGESLSEKCCPSQKLSDAKIAELGGGARSKDGRYRRQGCWFQHE